MLEFLKKLISPSDEAALVTKMQSIISSLEFESQSQERLYTVLRDFKEGRQWSNQTLNINGIPVWASDYGNRWYCRARPDDMEQVTFNRCGPVVDKFVGFLGIQKMELNVPKPFVLAAEQDLIEEEEISDSSIDAISVRTDFIEKLGKLVLYKDNDWKALSKVLAIDGATLGNMFWKSIWNPATKKIEIRKIDPSNVKIVCKDSSYLDILMSVEESYINIDILKKSPEDGGLNKDGKLDKLKDGASISPQYRNMARVRDIWIDEGTADKPKTRNIILVGDQDILVKNEVVEHPLGIYHVPTIRLAGKKFGESFIRQGIQLQIKINERLSDEAEIVKQYASPWIIDENSGQDPKDIVGGAQGAKVIPINEGGNIRFLEWSGRVYPVSQHIQTLINAFDDVVAMPKIAYGNIEQSIATGVSLTVSFQGTQTKIADWAENIDQAIRKMWKNNLLILEKEVAGVKDVIQGHYDVKVEWGERAPRDESLFITNILNMKQANVISDMTAREKLGIASPIDEQKQIIKEKNDPKYNPELALTKMQAMAQIEQVKAQQAQQKGALSEATGAALAGSNEASQRPTLSESMNTVPQPRQATGIGRGENSSPYEAPPQ